MSERFFPDSSITPEVLEPGKVSRKIKAHAGRLMLVEVSFETGGRGAEHDHPHEQVTYCLAGEFDFTVSGETQRLKAGDSVYVGPSERHGTLCLVKGRLLDTFTPQREDFLKR
jgi:quercetin dioxygenase-like cupin family protein